MADLLSRMTLDEKVGQMLQVERLTATTTQVKDNFIGSVLSGGGSNPTPNTPTAWADTVDAFQTASMQNPITNRTSSGSGQGLAERLIEQGARLVATARDVSKISDLMDKAPEQVVLPRRAC